MLCTCTHCHHTCTCIWGINYQMFLSKYLQRADPLFLLPLPSPSLSPSLPPSSLLTPSLTHSLPPHSLSFPPSSLPPSLPPSLTLSLSLLTPSLPPSLLSPPQDGYDPVCAHTDQGIEFVKRSVTFMEKLIHVEQNYAKELRYGHCSLVS